MEKEGLGKFSELISER